MTRVFVPLYPAQRGRASARVGWIPDANGCHIWQGARGGNGYGLVWDRSLRKARSVNRVRYEREVDPIPEGMYLDHFVCDNGGGGCCNPHHCRPVTPRENVLRSSKSAAAENTGKTHCKRGHLLAGDNLSQYRLTRNQRVCRLCIIIDTRLQTKANPEYFRAKNRRHYERRKARQAITRVEVTR